MSAISDLDRQLAFITELEHLKAIYRKTTVKVDNNRFENSAEHSWQIALSAQVLHPYAKEAVDVSRVVSMLLIHDIVEIDAGDTFAFAAQSELDNQHAKELAAAKRIFGLLPEPQYQEYLNLWLEFEASETTDARFAKGMDRILPLIQNMQNEGGSWRKHRVKKSQVLSRNQYLNDLTPDLWQFVCEQIELAVSNGWLLDE